KEDSLYFGVFLKVVYNCIWKMTHLCIKLRKLKKIRELKTIIACATIGEQKNREDETVENK
ncbi:MAG: hypothetical protein MSA76_08600, partial [Clostridium sp.]|nr:hypothetical protein [Clostridium sp.]